MKRNIHLTLIILAAIPPVQRMPHLVKRFSGWGDFPSNSVDVYIDRSPHRPVSPSSPHSTPQAQGPLAAPDSDLPLGSVALPCIRERDEANASLLSRALARHPRLPMLCPAFTVSMAGS